MELAPLGRGMPRYERVAFANDVACLRTILGCNTSYIAVVGLQRLPHASQVGDIHTTGRSAKLCCGQRAWGLRVSVRYAVCERMVLSPQSSLGAPTASGVRCVRTLQL